MPLSLSDSRWSTLLRGVFVTLTAILAISLVTLVLAGIWGHGTAELPYAPASGKPSNARLIFYAGTMPLISTFWTAVDLGLALSTVLSPLHALVSSTFLLCGWIVQFSVWMECELTAPAMEESFDSAPWCPNAMLSSHQSSLATTTENMAMAKSFIGLAALAGAFVYMVLAAVSVARSSRAAHIKDPEGEGEMLSSPP